MTKLCRSTLIVLLLCPAAALAQPGQLSLTLDEALQRGQRESLRLAEMQARVDAATAVEAGRQAAVRPLVAALAGYTRTNHVDEFLIAAPAQPARVLYPDVPDNFRTRLDLQWPIYSGGRTDALVRAARAEATARRRDRDRRRR